MAKIAEALTDSNPFLADSKEAITALAALDSKAATLTFSKATYNAELQTLRDCAREAGFSLVKLPNVPKVEDEAAGTVTEGYKLRDKIVVAEHTRPNRKSKAEKDADTVDTLNADAVA